MKGRAVAHANIALVKYWGKAGPTELNLPARGSLSLTLEALKTTTEVEFEGSLDDDVAVIDGHTADESATRRVSRFLDLVRARAGIEARARVISDSNFPAASGLASSASAFAALAGAATRAANLELHPRQLSLLARKGSGSAARSIYGGFVRMFTGAEDDEAFAEPLTSSWGGPNSELRMVIAIVGGGARKPISSRDAMKHCAETSPLYQGWLDTVDGDLRAAENAIFKRDLTALGEIMEASALAMHASMWAARPAIRFWRPQTVELIERVQALRSGGVPAYFTIDAGPHVKVLTSAPHVDAVIRELTGDDITTIVSAPGPDLQ